MGLWPFDPRKRPDARHFVWHGVVHPLCHLAQVENKALSSYFPRGGG